MSFKHRLWHWVKQTHPEWFQIVIFLKVTKEICDAMLSYWAVTNHHFVKSSPAPLRRGLTQSTYLDDITFNQHTLMTSPNPPFPIRRRILNSFFSRDSLDIDWSNKLSTTSSELSPSLAFDDAKTAQLNSSENQTPHSISENLFKNHYDKWFSRCFLKSFELFLR